MEHLNLQIKGKFTKYAELWAEHGYCFYDVDATDEDRNYLTRIITPILDENELQRKFIVVQGAADELNKAWQKAIAEK